MIMKILLVYPECPDTFWSFKYALHFVSKKAAYPPLGLLTIAPLLPSHWEKKLLDLNIESLKIRDILWADYVFIGAMSVQMKSGMEVMGGFIVGFDSDLPTIFRQQIDFIQQSGIVSAMIGMLNAPTKSKLYQKLHSKGRILDTWTGDNTDSSTNIIPKMNVADLKSGYLKIIQGIYDGKPFYNRVRHFLKEFEPQVKNRTRLNFNKIMALVKSMFIIGMYDNSRIHYWRLFFWTIFKRPKLFPLAITYSIYGYHFKRVFKKIG
jgi:hypothetical protein